MELYNVSISKVFNNSDPSESLIIRIERIDFIIPFVLRTLENEKRRGEKKREKKRKKKKKRINNSLDCMTYPIKLFRNGYKEQSTAWQ